MKYMVSLNGKQYEVIVERGTVTGSGRRTGTGPGRSSGRR